LQERIAEVLAVFDIQGVHQFSGTLRAPESDGSPDHFRSFALWSFNKRFLFLFEA